MRLRALARLLGDSIEIRRVALEAGQWHVIMRGPASIEDVRDPDLTSAVIEGIRKCNVAARGMLLPPQQRGEAQEG